MDIFLQEFETNDIQDRADLDTIFKTILEGYDMQPRVFEQPSPEPSQAEDDFIDDEAEEAPEGYESNHMQEDGEMDIESDDLELEYADE